MRVPGPSSWLRCALGAAPLVSLLCSAPAIAGEFSQVSHYAAGLFPRGTLEVETRIGDVTVEGWNEPRVEIEVEKVVRARSEAKAKRLFEQIKIEIKDYDEQLRLRAIFPPRRPWRLLRGATKLSVNFVIRMPKDANLFIKCVDGDLRIRGLSGDQEVRLNYGNVEINVPSLWHLRSLDARSFLGYVESNLHGEASAGFGRKVSFWNPEGEQEILVRVRFGGVYVYSHHNY